MANASVCASCLRALRLQTRKDLPRSSLTSPQRLNIRLYTTTNPNLAQAPTRPPPLSAAAPPSSSTAPPPSPLDMKSLASQLRNADVLRATTEPYIAYGSTEDLFRACTAQCSYTIPSLNLSPSEPAPKNSAQEDVGEGQGWWFQPKAQGGLGLDVTFNCWAQVMMLHMYLLTVRLRGFPAEHARVWHQNLLDHFFYAAEDRMAVWHGMSARGVRNKYLKDLWLQWRGALVSYDEGLVKGDAVLAGAVWRNMFKAGEDVDVGDVAVVVAYMRRQLRRLDGLEDARFAAGEVGFEGLEGVKGVVAKESTWVRRSFTEEDLKGFEVNAV